MSAKIFHIPFISHAKTLVLDAIVQRHPSPGDSAPEDHPTVKHYTTVEALVNDPAVDVVVVSTPPNTHYSFTRQAITAGKHVLVEKPFVPTSAEADELVALARKHNRLLCVYQNRRWDGDFVTVQALLREGTLGRVVELETHYDRLRPQRPSTWKGQLRMSSGGGTIYDLGTHLIDQVFVLFGMPSDVTGRFANQRLGKIVRGDEEDGALEPDSVKALLAYADTGLFVEVRIGVLSVETQQLRFWVRGTKGAYDKRGIDPQEDQLKAGMAVTDPRFGREDAKWQGRLRLTVGEHDAIEERPWPNVDPPETYLKFYELFAKAVASGREEDIPVPASEAAQVLRIIEAIRKSAETGTTVSLSP